MSGPREQYRRLLHERQGDAERLTRGDRSYSNARVLSFLIGAAALVVALVSDQLVWMGLVAMAVIGFIALVVAHENLARRRALIDRRVRYYERGLRRLDDQWQDDGDAGKGYAPRDHPYADDLDLFGPSSLFQRLCEARTRGGRQRLAAWLTDPAPFPVVAARQQALVDLRDRCELREELAVCGSELDEVDLDRVLAWTTGPALTRAKAWWLRPAMWGLPGLFAASVVAWAWFSFPAWPITLVVATQAWVLHTVRHDLASTRSTVERCGPAIEALARILTALEPLRLHDPKLKELHGQLVVDGQMPSQIISQLRRRVGAFEAYYGGWFAMLAFPLCWPAHCLVALESWRAQNGSAFPRWIDTVSEFEALLSLAAYAFENPDDPFPELDPQGPCFIAKELGHPLLPSSSCVRNSVYLDGTRQALLVSGSNMSGKSTFLRSVGVNAVLAAAGAPVRAKSLRISPLRIGATVRIEDSLQAGRSRFYAEILRLKLIVELAEATDGRHLLFLLDEVFHGTNSRDRRISATALLRLLVQKQALGLVTTHDLELTKVADELAPRLRNVHFCDELHGDKLHFDYTLRPGVVQRSNAQALMKAVGLALAVESPMLE